MAKKTTCENCGEISVEVHEETGEDTVPFCYQCGNECLDCGEWKEEGKAWCEDCASAHDMEADAGLDEDEDDEEDDDAW